MKMGQWRPATQSTRVTFISVGKDGLQSARNHLFNIYAEEYVMV